MRGPFEIATGAWDWLQSQGVGVWAPVVWSVTASGCYVFVKHSKDIIHLFAQPIVAAVVKSREAAANRDASISRMVATRREEEQEDQSRDVLRTAERLSVVAEPDDGNVEGGGRPKSDAA